MNAVANIPAQDKAAKKAEAMMRKAAKVAAKLKLFPVLTDDSLVDIHVVCTIRDRSPASIWRDVKAGRCPAPVSAGPRCTRWRVGDLRNAA